MLFNSLEFVIFVVIVIPLHALLKGKIWKAFMVFASYVFYGWANPWYCTLLLLSTFVDFNIGRRIGHTDDKSRKKQLLILSVITNLGILGIFKYSGFFIQSVNDIAHLFQLDLGLTAPELILPIGISFYTFQTLSYTVDVYRGKMDATDDFMSFALFVAFFPQLVAGPIERARDLLPQLNDPQPRGTDDILLGVTRIIWGLTKKVVIADNIAIYVNQIYNAPYFVHSNIEWLLATWLFAFQIYFDFSAYSDIAIGLARMMGIHINENFLHPYISKNIGEFWRRWHISLSLWLRDYLYIPLGGSRHGIARTVINVIIVFFLGGLWHGADIKYVVWGLWIGFAIAIYNLLAARLNIQSDLNDRIKWSDFIGIFITFQIMTIAWVFFRANSMDQAIHIFDNLLTQDTWTLVLEWSISNHTEVHLWLIFLIVTHIGRGMKFDRPLYRFQHPVLIGAFWGILLCIMLIFHADTTERFIYFQF